MLNEKKKFTQIPLFLQNWPQPESTKTRLAGIYLLSRTKKNNKKICSFSDEQRSRDAV